MSGRAAFVFVNGLFAIGLAAAIALLSGTPFIFPSLGPTAFMLFFAPEERAASPRSTLGAHAVGILCGWAALALFGLGHDPAALVSGVDLARVGCAALALASTGALMILLDVVHPPAGPTTLIVALGIIERPEYLLVIEAAVALLIIQALVVNRLAGVPYPIWDAPRGERR